MMPQTCGVSKIGRFFRKIIGVAAGMGQCFGLVCKHPSAVAAL
jgi:hypothetical protein